MVNTQIRPRTDRVAAYLSDPKAYCLYYEK